MGPPHPTGAVTATGGGARGSIGRSDGLKKTSRTGQGASYCTRGDGKEGQRQ